MSVSSAANSSTNSLSCTPLTASKPKQLVPQNVRGVASELLLSEGESIELIY